MFYTSHLLSRPLSRRDLGALLSRSFRTAFARGGFAFAEGSLHEPEYSIPLWLFLMLLMWKKQYQPKLMSPRVLHTLNFEECQFFHPDPKTPSQKHYKISCSRNANLNFLFSVESIKHLVMTILPTKLKSLQAHLSQQEQSNNEICYRPAERNCFTVLAN